VRRAASGAEVSRQRGEQFSVDGAEEALDLAAALGSTKGGVDDSDVQLDGGAVKVVAGEVRAMVDMQNVGNAAHRPGRIGLAPDRLPQSEGGVEGGGCAGEDRVAADCAGVVVHHGGQPGAVWFPIGAYDEDVEFGVVCLPRMVRPFGAATVDELVPIPV